MKSFLVLIFHVTGVFNLEYIIGKEVSSIKYQVIINIKFKVMKKSKPFLLISSLILVSSILMSTQKFNENSGNSSLLPDIDTSQWLALDSVNELVNPFEVNEESIAEGKTIYSRNCRSCHGKSGDGTGAGGQDLSTKVTDFTNPDFQQQSEGSVFWKISTGRNDMESYKEELDEDEIWKIVIYIKTFAPLD